ncbi:MAG: glutamine--fructose-6-phosphate transaminase (isomerizing) [Propionibacteriaceae bacterium]|jgi:glucosamine--fructose-6-phosphate aminotransferase (isomerizing)|nr:glutamine--fructose-6-phosphate transaminase (isomerizing) [Propionibacteriaceae bacterium]
MCGIVGYVGFQDAQTAIVSGLKRMEYRGYDSAGIALVNERGIEVRKKAGKIANLVQELEDHPIAPSHQGIGHTRWATHGGPTDENAHPHLGATGRVGLVHNGIIENFASLAAGLAADGVVLRSQTDSEIVAHLLEREVLVGHSLVEAMRRTVVQLRGAFTLVAVDAQSPGEVVAARRSSPLVVGVGQSEMFLASDVASFIAYTREAIELGQDQIVRITPDTVEVTMFDGTSAVTRPYHIDWDLSAAQKDGYDWFMRKEIFEQPKAVADTLLGRIGADRQLVLDEMRIDTAHLRTIDAIIVVAAGTAYHAGLIAKYAIEHWTRIPVEVELASEFRYRDPIVTSTTLVVTISQSGETADTLMAVRHAREQHAKVVSICNTNGATIPRESDAVIYTHAGPEIAVASTKGFTTQLIACYLLGLYLAQIRGTKFGDEVQRLVEELGSLSGKMDEVLDDLDGVLGLAEQLRDAEDFLFLGRHVGYPVALEGALKLKEISYTHAEGFAAGELKHGPIALVEKGLPIFIVVPPKGRDQLHDKVVSNIQEVRARGGRTIVLAERGDADAAAFADVFWPLPIVPTLFQPVLAILPLQVFACQIATLNGHDVDQPRNLAKSVTVE